MHADGKKIWKRTIKIIVLHKLSFSVSIVNLSTPALLAASITFIIKSIGTVLSARMLKLSSEEVLLRELISNARLSSGIFFLPDKNLPFLSYRNN